METAQTLQIIDISGNMISPATGIESLFFEQSYNGATYRTSLNNRLLVTGNNLQNVTKKAIVEKANNAELALYYLTRIKSDTASGLYRLDVSFYPINNVIESCKVIYDLSTKIKEEDDKLRDYIDDVSLDLINYKIECTSTYLPIRGGTMKGGIKFKEYGAGIVNNEGDLVLGSSTYLYLWGSLSDEYTPYGYGVRWEKPTIKENGKVPVYNYSGSNLVWSTYNLGSLNYTTANYKKYYILGITEDSYAARDVAATTYMAEDGYIEVNVYVSKKNMYANSFYSSSDVTLKTDIHTIDDSTYIPEVKEFKWIDSSLQSYGFIAQELEQNGLVELLEKDDNDRWRVNYNAVLSLTVGDLQKRVKTLEQENDKLKKELAAQKKLMKSIEERLSLLEQK